MNRRKGEDEPKPPSMAAFEAMRIRHEARLRAAKLAHEAAIAALEARMAAARIEQRRAKEGFEAKMVAKLGPIRRRKPPNIGKRPDEGGEAVPAVPRPKPKPLVGGAEAPLE